MKKYFLLIIAAATFQVLHAQTARKRIADKYFVSLDYALAAPIYNELAENVLKKNTLQKDTEIVKKAAITNEFCGNYQLSEKWYRVLYTNQLITKNDKLTYIRNLMFNGKYDEACQLIIQGYQADSLDNFYKSHLSYHAFISKLKKDSIVYEIRKEIFNSGSGDFAPAYYQGGIVFASKRINYGFVNNKYGWDNSYFIDCYFAPQKNLENNVKKVVPFHKIFRSKSHDGPVCFNQQNNTAFITRNKISSKNNLPVITLYLYISHKNDKGDWSEPESFPYNSNAYNIGHASISADGNTLYFASDMPGGVGGVDIYRSVYENGTWSKPQNLGVPVNTDQDEMFPYITANGVLYFASKGHVGLGGLDIFSAHGNQHHFTRITNMGYPLNTQNDDFALILDSTGTQGYFSSNREEMTDQIYQVNIHQPDFVIDGLVVEKTYLKDHIPTAEISIKNKNTGEITTLTSDEFGRFSYHVNSWDDFEISADKKNYLPVNTENVFLSSKKESAIIPVVLELEPVYIDFKCTILDENTQQPIQNAIVVITNRQTGNVTELLTNADGKIEVPVDRNNHYDVLVEKQGYLDLKEFFDTNDKNEVEKTLKLNIHKIKQGDMFTVNDLFYDFNKATLRPESYAELDILAHFLSNNPNIKVELRSHTDSRGPDANNLTLSQKRSQSCVDYLVSKGIPKSNIIAKGYGETMLLNQCKNGVTCTEEDHQVNRRTEIKILKVNE